MAKNILEQDYMRYPKASDMPAFQKYFRKVQSTSFFPLKIFYNLIFRILKEIRCVELPKTTQIGPGLYLGHAYNITILLRCQRFFLTFYRSFFNSVTFLCHLLHGPSKSPVDIAQKRVHVGTVRPRFPRTADT